MKDIDAIHKGKNLEDLKSAFEKDYVEQDFVVVMPEGNRKKYAHRIYGKGHPAPSLDSLLGATLMQREYAQYEGVYLVSDDEKKHLWSSDNLTDLPLAAPVLVSIPKSTKSTGIVVCLGNDEMTRPMLCQPGDKLLLTLRRDGYADLPLTVNVSGSSSGNLPLPSNLPWLRLVPYDTFKVELENDNNNSRKNISIDIAGCKFDPKLRCFLVPEQNMKKATVIVSCEGYDSLEKKVNLETYNPAGRLEVRLKRERKEITYKVGRDISFKMKRTISQFETSPLKGYAILSRDGDVVKLQHIVEKGGNGKSRTKNQRDKLYEYDDNDNQEDNEFYEENEDLGNGKKKWNWNIILLCTGLLIGLLLGSALGAYLGSSFTEKKMERIAQEEKARQKAEADSLQRVAMVAYLDSVPKWYKKEMDVVFDGKLQGMYDMLNYFDLQSVLEKAQELGLDSCREIQRLDSVVELMNKNPSYLLKVKALTNNKDDYGKFFSKDSTITFDNLFIHLENARKVVDDSLKNTPPSK